MTEATAHLPVRTRCLLGADGSSTITRWVFCRSRGRSLPLASCATCTHLREVPDERGDAVECVGVAPRRPAPRADIAEAAARALVAEIVAPQSFSVHADAPVAVLHAPAVRRVLLRAGCVPVVSNDGTLRGILARTAFPAGATAGEVATPPGEVLLETMSVSVAIPYLAGAPDGALPVVSDGGGVAGVLSCQDVVQWTARQLGDSMQPGLGRAASPHASV